MSNDKIKPKRLSNLYIRSQADELRGKYLSSPDTIPVPIEDIVEFDLRLELIPKAFIKQNIDLDGFLSRDLKTIYIDSELMNKRNLNRYRFTIAHEVGHYVLHSKEIQESEYRTTSEWSKMREEMDEEDLNWFEQQAYEFAGRLLVPRNRLIEALEDLREKIEKYKTSYPDSNYEIKEAIARVICGQFQVSPDVMERRIRKENVWEELNL